MRKIFLSALLIFSIFVSSGLAQRKKPAQVKPKTTNAATTPVKQTAPTQGIEVPFVNKTLANGLEVIVLADASVPLVSIEIAVRNGSFTEPPELNGLSHLYEHMFFKPNQSRLLFNCDMARANRNNGYYERAGCAEIVKLRPQIGDNSYLNELDDIGATTNASTREEVVNYYMTTTSPYVSTALRFMSDSIRFPSFKENELNDEIKVVIGEIDRNESNPFFFLNRTISDKLYFKYPTRKNPLGTRESVLSATVEKMKTIQNRYYVPNNSALVVTGDVNAEEIFKLAEKHFGAWPRREVEPFKEFPLVEHPPLPKSEGIIVEKQVSGEGQPENVFIQIGWHGPSIGKDDAATYAADVFSYIVGQPNSRFQRALVDSGLAVGTDIGYYTQRNVGPIQVTMVTSPDRAKPALKALYTEIAQFDKPNYFTDEELESAKTILESRDLFDREKLSEYAHTLSFWWSSTGIEYFRGYHKNLRAVTRAEINRYIKTYIQDKNRIGVALLSAEANKAAKLTEQDLIGK